VRIKKRFLDFHIHLGGYFNEDVIKAKSDNYPNQLKVIVGFAYTVFPLITQIADFYTKIYTQTQPLRLKRPGTILLTKLFEPAIVNLLNVVVCH
jgi:hypothetical protein